MSNRFSPGSRDKNEHLFTELLRATGTRYNLAPEGHGMDIYVFFPDGIDCWEIKRDDLPPSKTQLTECEKEMQAKCFMLNIPYFVFKTVEQAEDRINERRIG